MTPLPQRGEFEILIGDRTVRLKFSYASMARMEQRLGYGLTKLAQDVSQMNIKLNAIVAVVCEGAHAAKDLKDMDEEKIGDLVISSGYTVTARKVMECVMKMMTTGKEEVTPSGNEDPPEKEKMPIA